MGKNSSENKSNVFRDLTIRGGGGMDANHAGKANLH